MKEFTESTITGGPFHLVKWFLDVVTNDGEAMIFYAAKLTWHGWSVPYTSWLYYNPNTGVNVKSRFHHVQIPEQSKDQITWGDEKFGVSGTWMARAETIEARLFDSPEGHLDWKCLQPASEVTLRLGDRIVKGSGYAEQLILTAPPWKIPMNELRWGRFGSEAYNMVWIELRESEKKQWLWVNGERMEPCTIEDDHLSIPGKGMELKLDRSASLESEKKIFSVVENLIRYIPGFNKAMPVKFLMADESKWLSIGQLYLNDKIIANGMAIHELVNFNPV